MQTFLPNQDFTKSAELLDWRRLGKQRVETLQILRALLWETEGWRNHPAALMWEGYEFQLSRYGLYMCREWKRRGYNPGVTQPQLRALYNVMKEDPTAYPHAKPWWLGRKKFHQAHRRMLVWKAPNHYLGLFKDVLEVPEVKPEYWWPLRRQQRQE